MRINTISAFDNYQKANANVNNKSFQGYVNGKFYSDEIIQEAKNALKNPNWKEKFIARKITLGETLSNWHNREGSNDIAGRVIMGIFTLGISEITWGLSQRATDTNINKKIDQTIKEIEECMEDLGLGGQG